MNELPRSGYMAWNDALTAHFFTPDADGRQVHLFVTEDVVEEIGRQLDQGFADFINVIRAGPPGATRAGHCRARSAGRERMANS